MADWLDNYFEWDTVTNGLSMGASVLPRFRPETWRRVNIEPEFTMSEDYAVILGHRGDAKIVKLGWKDEDDTEETGDDDGSAAVRQSGSILRNEG